jgi:hypothetical protein
MSSSSSSNSTTTNSNSTVVPIPQGLEPKFTDNLHEVELTDVKSKPDTTNAPIVTTKPQGFDEITKEILDDIKSRSAGISIDSVPGRQKKVQFLDRCIDIACNIPLIGGLEGMGGSRYVGVPRLTSDAVLDTGVVGRKGAVGVGFGQDIGGFQYLLLQDTGQSGFDKAGVSTMEVKDALSNIQKQTLAGHIPKTSAKTRGYDQAVFEALTAEQQQQVDYFHRGFLSLILLGLLGLLWSSKKQM